MENRNEIDLIELLIKIYLYLKRYVWIFLIAIAIAIIFTILKSTFQKPVYTSSMVIETKSENDFMYALTFREIQQRFEKNPGELIVKIINSANNLIQNGNIEVLANRMGITTEEAIQINSVSASYKYTKGEAVSNYVTINVSSSNKIIFKDLNTGIKNYINNNTFIKNKYSSDSIFLSNIIKKVDKKIIELDSLQNKFLKDGIVSDMFIFKESSFFLENIMLTSLKEKFIEELNNLDQINIVENFYIPQKKSPFNKNDFIINIAVFIFLSFIIIFIIIINTKANHYKNKS